MTRKTLCTAAVALGLLALAILGSGCSGNLPHVSYQGRLTDASGNPLNGSVDITIRLYHTDTGGTPYYTDTNSGVTVTDGLFDVVIDPSAVGDLSPADINQASWIEVEIDNGTYSETLSPRQQVLGAPYAMTLMAGTTISSTMDSFWWGGLGGMTAVVNIQNSSDTGLPTYYALPALRHCSQECQFDKTDRAHCLRHG